jgi:hypothetical protein
MKRLIALLSLLAALVVIVPMALSAPAPNPLAGRVSALEQQVKVLRKQLVATRSDLGRVKGDLAANYGADACMLALTGDVFQGTWSVIDQVSQATMSKVFFGPQSPLNDKGGCTRPTPPIGVTRPANQVPGSLSSFQKVIDWNQG